MQVTAIRRGESRVGDELIDQAHCLRARVFQDRLAWNVTTRDGREFDEYDQLDATYLLVTDSSRCQVIGCARLLPGDGPTMLTGTFPQLLDSPAAFGRGCIESSRFCVDTASTPEGKGARGLHRATMALFAGILEWSQANGYSEVITVTDLRLERIFSRAGLPFHRLGQPLPIGNTTAVAGWIPVTPENARSVRPAGYRSHFRHPMGLAA